jgi:phage shock protein E
MVQARRTMRTLLLALTLVVSGCSRSEAPPEPAPAKQGKDPAAARTLISSGALVLDVRTPEEFDEEHLPKATNVPVDKVGDRLAEIEQLAGGDKHRPIVVYCASGGRSAKAKRVLESAGYTRVVNGGGLDDLR